MEIYYSEIFKKTNLSKEIISKLQKILPQKFFLAYTVQYKTLAFKLKEFFRENIIGLSQITGCSKIPKQITILLLGDGKFHAINLLNYAERVIIFNGQNFLEIGKKEKQKIEEQNKAKFSKLFFETKIGILISIKPGQYNIKEALKVKIKLLELKKKAYFFFFDTLNQQDLENFNIKVWINTSCPGLEYDFKNILNAKTFFQLLNSIK